MVRKRLGTQARIKLALVRIRREITGHAQRGDIAAGLAGEGYAGGYADALMDLQLLLRGIEPCIRPGYWRVDKEDL